MAKPTDTLVLRQGSSVYLNRHPVFRAVSGLFTAAVATAMVACAQMLPPTSGPLDPARTAKLLSPPQGRLTEQFIWTADDAAALDPKLQASVRGQDDKISPHFFRVHFHVSVVPRNATLYIAGPRAATVYLNGQEVLRTSDDGTRPKNLTVMTADVAHALMRGDNVLAIELVRGHSSLHTGASATINQITYGEVLAAKIVPAGAGVDEPPLMVSGTHWRSSLQPAAGWQAAAFYDAAWPEVTSLGVLGSRQDFLQWNADAGLYAWPGYQGISADLRVFPVEPVRTIPAGDSLLYDFGREIAGRVRIVSSANVETVVATSYGESPEEALEDKSYLGVRAITVPSGGVAYGPKSGFRYVKVKAPTGTGGVEVNAEAIAFPVEYLGSFESSDAQINRIWETAAYTARLCMQEGIWDGVKRDRGRWMGDLDVTGRTIDTVFASSAARDLMEQTMTGIIGEPPVSRDINTIAGYSALWITGEADFYRHYGDLPYLHSIHNRLLGLLKVMDGELDAGGLFTNPEHHKVFVDWSEGFTADTPEARAATHLEFVLAYAEAAFLLDELGDREHAAAYRLQEKKLQAAAQDHLLDRSTGTFGKRWQTNAWAVVSGSVAPMQKAAVWQRVLSHVGEAGAVITPYQGYYVLSAMAKLDHRDSALAWMRSYWGGMLAEGATSFWEAYDPHWPKTDFHSFLEADNKRGYYVSLAHGWASGPAAWLTEEVLGIRPEAAGFRRVLIRPDLAGLAWAQGAEPTPHGLLRVEVRPAMLEVTLPTATEALVQLPFAPDVGRVYLNDKALRGRVATVDGRMQVVVSGPGRYVFTIGKEGSR